MSLYIIVSRGQRADNAIPILASSDPQIIDAALQAIARLDEHERGADRPAMDCTTTQSDGEDANEPRS